jgi:feruloyl esterase
LSRGVRIATKVARAELGMVKLENMWPRQPLVDLVRKPGRLWETTEQGENPGRLRMLTHVPATPIKPGRPLVVVLHGCGQGAAAFAEDTGWNEAADRGGFPLLLPEQAEANNQGRCFRWFQPDQTGRDRGEAASIIEMVQTVIARHQTDPRQVYVVGLSAGGAMAAALLASYPDVFAAGAVVAGLPVGAASSTMQALMRMSQAGPSRTPEEWAAQVRQAGPAGFSGAWPRLSIWQGEADTVVAPENANLLATQWRALHGLPDVPVSDTTRLGARCRRWGNGRAPAVELWTIPGMPHGYPIGEGVGRASAYVPLAPVAATPAIASFWGIA